MSLWIDEIATEHDDASRDLVDLLASVLRMQSEVRDALEAIDGIDMAEVPWPAVTFKARQFWTAYVLDLRRAASLKKLVASMAEQFPPKRADFTRFLQLSAARPAGWYTVGDPLNAQFVGPGASHPMIDRKRLRESLGALHSEGYRTLNITGGPASGKTFSLQLVQALAQHARFPILHVDVADWGTEKFTAVSLVQAFAKQLQIKIKISSESSVPDPHTRARLLLFEFRDAFPTSDRVRWIVIDGLDRANVDPDARAFVERLLKSIDVDGKPENVRLVVTGFDGLLPDDSRKDPIGTITRDDVFALFDLSTKQLAHDVTPAKLEKWTDKVWNAFDPAKNDLGDLGDSVYNIVHGEIKGVDDDDDDDDEEADE